jgi:hypothetical protein
MEFNPEQTREGNGNWTNAGKGKLMSLLKKRKKVVVRDTDGVVAFMFVKPQDHGIKKALLVRPLIADTSLTLQRLVIDILHTTTEENVKEMILTAMKKIKRETELFTKQLERHIVEAEIKDYRKLTEEVITIDKCSERNDY